ncbi:M3 family metallopeptidase [Paucibacter sp. PLA-PC-4]|uniref:M3 family metallopeptidase n=1 Tax=Paucibacter sp. PLA-PC-4 TaxID=2993655 RepID=UPI00224B1BD5|nr:M3 family metallopeptidase [Paucibacter sp. PLA-PC-4]MCX2863724.1 M3 family metallopeptidase [Paucibacter sp. PLA-PC-4]
MTHAIDSSLLVTDSLPRFTAFRPNEVVQAITELLTRCEAALAEVTKASMPADFQLISQHLDVPTQALGRGWGTVMHLHAVLDSPELRAAVEATQPAVSEFFSKRGSNQQLYELYKRVAGEGGASLSAAQRKSVEDNLRDCRLSGSELNPAQRARFIEIQQRLAILSREFSNHVLDATDTYAYWATAEELDGVPQDLLQRLAQAAEAEGREGFYKVTLHQPVFGPVMQHARRRDLRETLYRAGSTRASEFGAVELDNGPVLNEILDLRQERAALLGFVSHAEVSLVSKMATSPDEVIAFLRDLGRSAREQGEKDLAELAAFAAKRLGLVQLQAWDIAFVSERLREDRYAFSEEEVKRHFRLDNVLDGLFDIAQQLFAVSITATDVDTWHSTVRAFRVQRGDRLLGHFFLDPFARPGKRGGAWMNGAEPRWRRPDGSLRSATAHLVTNFAEPGEGQAPLLRHGEVVTLFHEFGHGLHFLLSEEEVLGVSGISGVEWDAIELPSQLMENFAWQWPILERITKSPVTGQGLPRDLFDKMVAARNFQNGISLLRQIELAMFDMRLHAEPLRAGNVQTLMDDVRAEVSVVNTPTFNRFQNSFSHIFAGGYSAGYYSYLWAEVLASDAWEAFEESGVVNPSTGQHYLDCILARGGSRPMAESFEAFRGRQPTIDALLRQRGLAASTRPAAERPIQDQRR